MNSCISSIPYSSYGSTGKIEPALHILNSLGLPKRSDHSSMSSMGNYNSSGSGFRVINSNSRTSTSGHYTSQQMATDMLKYETAYSPKTYRPASMYNIQASASKVDHGSVNPVLYRGGIGDSSSNHNFNYAGDSAARAAGKCGAWLGGFANPDENNNFLRDKRGRQCQCGEKQQEDPSERISQLAQPKRLPCEYQEDRSVFWTGRRFKPNCGNHTHFETTPRLDELAIPKSMKSEVITQRPNVCDMGYSFFPQQVAEPDARVVDWNRLATPKRKYPPNCRPIQHVKRSALKAAPTKRLCKLSVPKPVIDAAKFYLWLWSKKPDDKIRLRKVERLVISKVHFPEMRVMVRCDLDPCTGGGLEAKIAAVLPTIKYILTKGPKSLIIVSNRTSACGSRINVSELSLRSLAPRFEELLKTPVLFLDDCVGYQARVLCEDPEPGNIFLLENLAFHPEETGKGVNENGEEFTCSPEKVEEFRKEFFNHADIYVIDSFRELVIMTNTTIGYPKQEKAYGFKVKSELDSYNLFVSHPKRPMVAIIGGAFKDTKLIVRNLMGVATDIIIGGEIALTFLKMIKRTDMGNTKITAKMEKQALSLHSRAKDTKTGLMLPSDLVVRRAGTEEYFTVLTRDDVDDDFEIVDIGPFTRKCYTRVINEAETLLWWGEMGIICDGTNAIAAAFSRAADRGARTYVADDNTKANIDPNTQTNRKTHVTEDCVATTMLLKGILPKGLAVLNGPRKKVKKHEPPPIPMSRKPIRYDIPGMQIASGEKIMCINDINIEGKNVLLRVDFHVPMQGNKILNNYRIRMTVPTIKYALKWRARTVVILGHLGYPDGKKEESLTLKPICDELASLLGQTVIFVQETIGKQAETAINNAHPGTVIMLENVRFHMEETGSGTPKGGIMWKTTKTEATPQAIATFCEKITQLGNVFVNDAFACLNLDHSSIVNYYQPTRVCGFLVKNELKYMARICNYPQRRFLVILGGNNFKEKLPILRDLLREADDIVLVGSLGVAFLKVYLNMAVGASVFDPVYEKDIKAIIDLSEYYTCRLYYPVDCVIANNKSGENSQLISITEPIQADQMVIDIGELTSGMICRIIKRAKMVFWVGVCGIAESEAGSKATKKIMDCIIDMTKDPEKNLISIVGGRSTSEAIDRFEKGHESFTHLTTGSVAAFKLLTDRCLFAVDTLMPKPSKRPIRVMGIDQLDVTDKRILIRADLGIPTREDIVVDSFPLITLASTIKSLLKKNAKSVVLISHRGFPDGKINEDLSLRPMKQSLEELLEQDVFFAEDGVSEAAESASRSPGRVVLVENVRFHPEEEGIKDGPNGTRVKVSYEALEEFRSKLTALGDIFMNESLDSIHLTHSSVIGIGDIKKVAGPTLKKNLQTFEAIKKTLERPLLAIFGGDQPLEAIPSLYQILDLVDEVIICGDLAFTFLKCEAGAKLGKSPFSQASFKIVPRIMRKAKSNNVRIHLPTDYVADEDPYNKVPEPSAEEKTEEENPEEVIVKEEKEAVYTVARGIPDEQMALDIGPDTIANFINVIAEAKTIIMAGVITKFYTFPRFQTGTKAVLEAIQKATANGVQTVALGTKIAACLHKLEAVESFSIYSNGYRAFYSILRGRPLPGLQILQESPARPLKKLSVHQMDLSNQRVLIRLDLYVPTVEGVALDTDKLEEAQPTISYVLDKGAKCVVLLGHRGDPNGYKNIYLSMKPLIPDLSQILEKPVTLIDRPCSKKAKAMLADPAPGSVFLMENLKYYSAEYGIDAEVKESRSKRKDMDVTESIKEEEAPPPGSPPETVPVVDDTQPTPTESTATVSDEEGGVNIDSLMYQLMTPKTVAEFNADLAACGDVFINDDVTDIGANFTSLMGFGLPQRGCGLLLATYLSDMDDPEMYNLPTIAALSPMA